MKRVPVADLSRLAVRGLILLALDTPPTAPSGRPTMAFEYGTTEPIHLLNADNLHRATCGLVTNWLIPFQSPLPMPTFCHDCIELYVGKVGTRVARLGAQPTFRETHSHDPAGRLA